VKYSPRVDSFPGVFGTSIGGGILASNRAQRLTR